MADEATVRRRWWAAGLIGLAAPGLGQLYTGRARLAGFVIGTFVMLFALFYTAIPSTFVGFVALFGGALLVSWGAAIEAGAYAWRRGIVERRSYHRWYVYVAYAVAFTAIGQGINHGLLAAIGLPSMFGAYRLYSASSRPLEPGLMEGEYFLVATERGATTQELSDQLGSIVIVSWPDDVGPYAYRLFALGGQTVVVTDGKVLVDEKERPQRLICTVIDPSSGNQARRSIETIAGRSYVVQNFDEFVRDTDEITIGDNQFFVMGDTRENSNDSRFRGPVDNANYAGRALFIFWSNDWRRIGKSLTPGASIEASEYCPPAAK